MRRRTFVLSLGGALAGGLSLPAGAKDATARTLLIGSSMMAGAFGMFLEQKLRTRGHVTRRVTRSASGLSRPDFWDWPKVLAQTCDAFAPNLTIVMFGANDAQSIYERSLDPRWVYWDDARWTDLYGQRVSTICDLASPGGRLAWLGVPIMRPSKLDRRLRRIHRIYRAEASHRPNVEYISTRTVLADRNGRYTDHLRIDGRSQLVRASDGVHVARAGAQALVRYVLPRILEFASAPLPNPRPSDHNCIDRRPTISS